MFTYLINLREHLSSTTVFLVGSVLLIFFCFMCCPIRCLCSDFRVVMSVTISAWKRCSVRLHLQLFVGGRISYLRYFCLFTQWCLTHIVLCFCFIFLRLMNTMLPVSLDCPFLIAPSVFSSVYFRVLIQVLQVNMNLRFVIAYWNCNCSNFYRSKHMAFLDRLIIWLQMNYLKFVRKCF